jgi:acyl-CoA reductase-like NAD-dependent aldehyde dehydrogenase
MEHVPFHSPAEVDGITGFRVVGGAITHAVLCPDGEFHAYLLPVDAGGVVVGGNGNYRLTQQPFNGHKMSGMGSEGTMYTLHEMVKVKTIVLKNVF